MFLTKVKYSKAILLPNFVLTSIIQSLFLTHEYVCGIKIGMRKSRTLHINFKKVQTAELFSDQLEDYHLIQHTLQQCRQYNGWTCTSHLVRICRHTQHKLINKVRHMTLTQKWTEKSEMLACMHITGSLSMWAFFVLRIDSPPMVQV